MNNINRKYKRGGGSLSSYYAAFRDLVALKKSFSAFTLAEMMVVMLILSIVMAAMAPVMTTRNKLDQSSPWSWADNGSDAYYGIGDAQVAMIGQEEAKDNDIGSRLVINAPAGKNHILFKQGTSPLGQLYISSNSILLGDLYSNTAVNSRAMGIGQDIMGLGNDAIAIGYSSDARGQGAIGIGNKVMATGANAIAIGGEYSTEYTTASGRHSIAVGVNASSGGESSIAIGDESKAITDNSIALGTSNSISGGANAIAIGTDNTLTEACTNSIVMGHDNEVRKPYSIAIGDNLAITSGNYNIGIGYGVSSYDKGIAIGYSTSNTEGNTTPTYAGSNSIAVGYNAYGPGTESIAIGHSSKAYVTGAIAIGYNTNAYAQRAIAIGYSSGFTSSDEEGLNNRDSVAIGSNVRSHGIGTVSLGTSVGVSSDYAVAIGNQTAARQGSTIAIGYMAEAGTSGNLKPGNSAIAIGNSAKALGNDNIAIGRGACQYVTGSNKVCIGANSGPASSYPYRNDQEERIFIGSAPKYISSGNRAYISKNGNIAAAVLEVHNLKSDEPRVVINGNLIVRGSIAVKPSNRNTFVQMFVGGSPGGDVDQFEEGTEFNINAITDIMTMQFSDRRLKYVGKENTSGLDKIRELKVFNYTFKKDEKKTPHVGVIAQDLQKVFPDAVSKAKDGFLRIRFEDMFYAMINAIKELDSRITAIEKENQQLKEILKQVQNDNKKMDARLKLLENKVK